MRVLFQCGSIVPTHSCGIENFAYGLLGGMARAFPEVVFLVIIPANTRSAWQHQVPTLPNIQLVELASHAALVQWIVAMQKFPVIGNLRRFLKRLMPRLSVLGARRQRLERQYANMLAVDLSYYPFHWDAISQTPAVVTVHDLLAQQFPEIFGEQTRAIAEQTIQRSTAVVTSWPHPFAQLKERYPAVREKLFWIPFPVIMTSDARISSSTNSREEFILSVSATGAHKNHLNLIKALALVRQKRSVRLICTGSKVSPYYEEAERGVNEIGLQDAVEFRGFVTRSELMSLYARAAMVVAPTLWEAASGAVFEGFAHHKPVGCSDIPPVQMQVEFCGGHVRFFDPLDPQSIADAILDVLTNPAPFIEGSQRAAAFLRQFAWERTAEDYMAVFEWVLSGCLPDVKPSMSIEHSERMV